MTLSEKIAYAYIGKTFKHFCEGEVIAEGIVIGVAFGAIQLSVSENGEEWFETLALTEIGYDRIKKTGYRMSMENPHRKELID